MNDTPRKDAIRNAATVVLIRQDSHVPRVLMGQRGKKAAFMPSKFVFPGGAVDAQDHEAAAVRPLSQPVREKLEHRADAAIAAALPLTAIRELWEESGLAIATDQGQAPAEPLSEWVTFFAEGHRPDASGLDFIFRAITPPGRPRRFDARFFLAAADVIRGDLDDFTHATDELSHLCWLTLPEARELDLPFITEVVLAEVEARLAAPADPRPIPFFYNQDGISHIDQI